MYGNNLRAPKVSVHKFSMIPRAEIPRSAFRMQHQHKTTIGCSALTPVMVQEVLPGDSFHCNMTAFCRMATPIYPIMDNLDLESWFFFVPCRIVWQHWVNMMGEQTSAPTDSISYTVPQITNIPASGITFTGVGASLYDWMGIPGNGQLAVGGVLSINALPFRAYNMIWNTWFRDENLQPAFGYGATNSVFDIGDGPDPYTNYALLGINRRHDYFSSCLPFTQKNPTTGGTAISFLTGNANVFTASSQTVTGAQQPLSWLTVTGAVPSPNTLGTGSSGNTYVSSTASVQTTQVYPANLYANLGAATQNTINSLRLAFQTQKLLERDARGGTRYQELIMSHFGVHPLDARVQRPEYLGGGKSPVNMAPVPQTSATGLTGGTASLGTLSGVGTIVGGKHGFRASFTEHGYVLGLVSVRSERTYQQGLHRLWTRQTRYDFYWPVFAMLGEQSVRNDEIFCQGSAADSQTFGFQERWAEYRYMPSRTSGFFRSTNPTPLDAWHLATKFTAPPQLNTNFVADDTQVAVTRCLAAGANAVGEQFLVDLFFDVHAARPMPMYSVPGLIDHF